ncbi:fasciclin domain-containing protein [Sphingobacterium bovistauri]|uniref:Fasciclin domain-containing protein n=1 Tax=Sphingobacterium bovistauri TaxID=2781959 RepID=A0ABS7Z102_9SPHI|nr:fasciclin domain-containing protein [Sphingobacterium bovistauri]MCA5003838.1 fasciclin domain-containing protein [Sphingobacterium bovistauri]
MKRFLNQYWIYGVLTILVVIFINSCQKENYRQTTTDEVNITGYLENNKDQFSLFVDILYRSKTAGFLGAYGTYTLFAPTNDAVTEWIKANGKSAVTDFSESDLVDFVKYHVIRDTVATTRFSDGKIKSPTLFGEYLFTDLTDQTYRINRTASLSKSNIYTGNGLIHIVNKVLTPPALSLAEIIEKNPNYSIFTEALKETGFYDTLYFERGNIVPVEKRFQTVIVESDSVLKTQGINDYAALKQKYSHLNNPKNPNDSLWLYMAYHIMNDGKFLEDIIQSLSLYTLAPKEIISTKFENSKVLLNEDIFNGVLEPGAELNRSKSDVLASNGVMHETNQSFRIKVRPQVPVYFDLASAPEMVSALGGSYRNRQTSLIANGLPIANTFTFYPLNVSTVGTNRYTTTALSTKRPGVNGDYLDLTMSTTSPNRPTTFEIKTPFLVKGRYKVWVCYVQNSNAANLQVTFNPGKSDEQVLPNLIMLNQTLTGSGVNATVLGTDPNSDNLLLAQGYKRYYATVGDVNANGVTQSLLAKNGDGLLNVGRLAGTINVETTDRHTLSFYAISEPRWSSNAVWLDMVHFIPADDPEQYYPRFHHYPGELFYRPQ